MCTRSADAESPRRLIGSPPLEAITRRSAAEPTASLALDFVNGLPGASIGNALKVTPCGKVVYYVAALGVVYDRATHRQRFFTGHDDDVRSIAQHPDGYTFATGQDGARPSVCVWTSRREAKDPVDLPCAQLARVADTEGYMRSFVALAFDKTGDVLVSMGSRQQTHRDAVGLEEQTRPGAVGEGAHDPGCGARGVGRDC